MKKYIVALLIFCAVAAIILWKVFFADNNKYIYEANANIDIKGLKLLASENSVKSLLDKEFIASGGFGCRPYDSYSGDVKIIFSGFPDVTDDYVLTDITTTSPEYSFYGIYVGDTSKKAADILSSNGFHRITKGISKQCMVFNKNKLNVSILLSSDGRIAEIAIRLSSTNKRNVVF